jgi:alpha-aminoadipate/glutamate carrier protein LysW
MDSTALYNTPARFESHPWPGGSAVVRCPECAVEIDVDEDEVEEGEILSCPECEVEIEVVQVHPVRLNVISDEDEDEEEAESDEKDDLESDALSEEEDEVE